MTMIRNPLFGFPSGGRGWRPGEDQMWPGLCT